MPPALPSECPVDIPIKAHGVRNRMGILALLILLVIAAVLMFLIAVNLGFVLAKGVSALPDVKLLESWQPNQSTRIFDRDGELIANIHGDEDRVVVPLKEISPYIRRAVMAIEDNRFYQHNGIDIRGTARALAQNLKGGDVQGGSTLTQQLVKNLFLSPERSIGRKLAEALLALRVEQFYDKNRILEMYLNQVYWGNQAYGIEKAARRYFKKSARELTIPESALLAGLLKAPEGLSPFAYPKAARKRQLEVLNAMEHFGYITAEQHQNAIKTQLVFNDQKIHASKHPYFVAHVIQELMQLYGEDVVRRGGLRVYSSMDAAAQTAAEKAVEEALKVIPKSAHVNQTALVSMDVETGEILAMIGGLDFTKSQFNTATQARRAAGSTFKPVVYLTALRLGLITPDSPISDRPVRFNTGYSIWVPKNWDGRFMGAMTIRKALALSRNTPTVQIGMKVGIDEVIKTARSAGVSSPIDANFSSLLGSSGVSPLEMLTVYNTFARLGERVMPTAIRRIEDATGQEVAIERPEAEHVFDAFNVSQLVSMLIDVVEKGTGKAAMIEGRSVAGKTGTTDSVRDIWFAGFTPDVSTVVWMGNDRYIPLQGVFSSNAARVFHDYMAGYYEAHPLPKRGFDLVLTRDIDPAARGKNRRNATQNDAPARPLPRFSEDRDDDAVNPGMVDDAGNLIRVEPAAVSSHLPSRAVSVPASSQPAPPPGLLPLRANPNGGNAGGNTGGGGSNHPVAPSAPPSSAGLKPSNPPASQSPSSAPPPPVPVAPVPE
ncbi:MAG: PBP1A family penicillin-binding protein [Vampirovibrionales bacterium]|nr:PBP1A family penicillin-binding protein [Vampirovibrionales bacterium]